MGKSSKEAVDEIKPFDSVEKTRVDRDAGIASDRKRKLIAECTMMDDIFMNLVAKDGVEIQRARFHSSMLDTTMFTSNQKFKELKESYVIFKSGIKGTNQLF